MTSPPDYLLRQAIEAASAAALDAQRWHEFVETLSAATNAGGSALFRPGPGPIGGALALQGSMVQNQQAYFDHWVLLDPWTKAINERGLFQKAGEALFSQELISPADYARTPYFDGHGRQHDSGHKLFLKVCDDQDPVAPVTHLTLTRSLQQEPFGDAERALVERLWPHLRQAIQAYTVLRQVQATQRLAESHLDHWPLPCWVVRADGWIEFANQAALAQLRTAPWVRVATGRLSRIGTLATASLTALVQQASSGVGAQTTLAYPVAAGQHLARASLRAVPIKGAPLFATMWPQAAALIVLELERHDDRDWIRSHLAPHYKLTDMECRVLEHLAGGQEPGAIGERLGISVVTVRTHLRALREKTDRRSQVELVRLALGR